MLRFAFVFLFLQIAATAPNFGMDLSKLCEGKFGAGLPLPPKKRTKIDRTPNDELEFLKRQKELSKYAQENEFQAIMSLLHHTKKENGEAYFPEFQKNSPYYSIVKRPSQRLFGEYKRIVEEHGQIDPNTGKRTLELKVFVKPFIDAIRADVSKSLLENLDLLYSDSASLKDDERLRLTYLALAELAILEKNLTTQEDELFFIESIGKLILAPSVDLEFIAQKLYEFGVSQSSLWPTIHKTAALTETPNRVLRIESILLLSLKIDSAEAHRFTLNSPVLQNYTHPIAIVSLLSQDPTNEEWNLKLIKALGASFTDEVSEDEKGDVFLNALSEDVPLAVSVFDAFKLDDAFYATALKHFGQLSLQETLIVLRKLRFQQLEPSLFRDVLNRLMSSPYYQVRRIAALILLDVPDAALSETDVTGIIDAKPSISKETTERLLPFISIADIPRYLEYISRDMKISRASIKTLLQRFHAGDFSGIKRVMWSKSDQIIIESLIDTQSELGYALLAYATDISDSQLHKTIKWLKHATTPNEDQIRASILENTSMERFFSLAKRNGRLDPSFAIILEFIADSNPADAYSAAISMLRLIEWATPEQLPTVAEITAAFITKNQLWQRLVFDTEDHDMMKADAFLLQSIVGLLYATEGTPNRSPATKQLVFKGRESHHPLCEAIQFKDERRSAKEEERNKASNKGKTKPAKNLAAPSEKPSESVPSDNPYLKFLLVQIRQRNPSLILSNLKTGKVRVSDLPDAAVQTMFLMPTMTANNGAVERLSQEEIELRNLLTEQASLSQVLGMLGSVRQSLAIVAADVLLRRINALNEDVLTEEGLNLLIAGLAARLSVKNEGRASVREVVFNVMKTLLATLDYKLNSSQFAQVLGGFKEYYAKAPPIKVADVHFFLHFLVHSEAEQSAQTIALVKHIMALPTGRLPTDAEVKTWQVWNQAYQDNLEAPYKGLLAFFLFHHQGFQRIEYQNEIKVSVANLTRSHKPHLSTLLTSALNDIPPYRFHSDLNILSSQEHFHPTYVLSMGEFRIDENLKLLLKALQAEMTKPQLGPSKEPNQKITRLMEEIGMLRTMQFELTQGRTPIDVSHSHFGYDIHSIDLRTGEVRNIEVKAKFKNNPELIPTKHELNTAEAVLAEGRSHYYFYIPNIYSGDHSYSLNGVEIFKDPRRDHILGFVISETSTDYLVPRHALNAFRVSN